MQCESGRGNVGTVQAAAGSTLWSARPRCLGKYTPIRIGVLRTSMIRRSSSGFHDPLPFVSSGFSTWFQCSMHCRSVFGGICARQATQRRGGSLLDTFAHRSRRFCKNIFSVLHLRFDPPCLRFRSKTALSCGARSESQGPVLVRGTQFDAGRNAARDESGATCRLRSFA